MLKLDAKACVSEEDAKSLCALQISWPFSRKTIFVDREPMSTTTVGVGSFPKMRAMLTLSISSARSAKPAVWNMR